jgi:uncharacterized phiE125 gp8 family phage protein
MIIQRTSVSTAPPVNVAEVAEHARIEESYFAAEAHRLSLAAAREFEDFAQIALLEQTISVTIEGPIRCAMLALPIAPLVDPLSVEVTVDGVDFEGFAVITGLRPALRFTDEKPTGLVVVTYLAGFGATASSLPEDIRHAIADQVVALFEMRGELPPGGHVHTGMSPHMARIAARYRRVAL